MSNIANLVAEKENELNVFIVERREDVKGNVHYLAKRNERGDYAVWTSYRPSHNDFYNGSYHDSLIEAVDEYSRRIKANGFVAV